MRVKVDEQKAKELMSKMQERMETEGIKPPFPVGERVPEMMQALSLRPDILQAFMPFSKAVYYEGRVDRLIKEEIFVKVSEMNKCQFCMVAHTSALKQFGYSDEEIEDVKQVRNVTDKQKVALEYAEQVTIDANKVSDELFNRLKGHFNDGDIVELTLAIGLINLLNKFNDALQVRLEL